MRGTLMATLAGGPREPRAWKLASVVRGGAVGKGLCSSTSLAAYSTSAARAWISSAVAFCGLPGKGRPTRPPAHGNQPRHSPWPRSPAPRSSQSRSGRLASLQWDQAADTGRSSVPALSRPTPCTGCRRAREDKACPLHCSVYVLPILFCFSLSPKVGKIRCGVEYAEEAAAVLRLALAFAAGPQLLR
jgi:hypothetical protein